MLITRSQSPKYVKGGQKLRDLEFKPKDLSTKHVLRYLSMKLISPLIIIIFLDLDKYVWINQNTGLSWKVPNVQYLIIW